MELLTGTWLTKVSKTRAAAALVAEGAGTANATTAASTLGQIAPHIADDAIVTFGSVARTCVSPPGGASYWFRWGDIKHLTPTQIRSLIGDMAAAGQAEGSKVVRVAKLGREAFEEVASSMGGCEYKAREAVEVAESIALPGA